MRRVLLTLTAILTAVTLTACGAPAAGPDDVPGQPDPEASALAPSTDASAPSAEPSAPAGGGDDRFCEQFNDAVAVNNREHGSVPELLSATNEAFAGIDAPAPAELHDDFVTVRELYAEISELQLAQDWMGIAQWAQSQGEQAAGASERLFTACETPGTLDFGLE
ncbi:hypothetical protein [Microbacterium album]|uniref:Lipoprotein n=1 Tax=Microbacterium album TaxID=2053191 RepID=A0A917IE87_9MICO|nr:hypothetical protein [Microbacterium album]GGH44051.1 hypothetical protein GCM10010921_18440 [Microbacterium album]